MSQLCIEVSSSIESYTVNSLLTDAPTSGLTRYSGHTMHGLISLYYCTKINSRLTDSLVSGQRTLGLNTVVQYIVSWLTDSGRGITINACISHVQCINKCVQSIYKLESLSLESHKFSRGCDSRYIVYTVLLRYTDVEIAPFELETVST